MTNALPPFRRIAQTLRDEIGSGRLGPGDRLPSENQLAEQYGTTRPTVRKAIALLRSEGLVISQQGRAVFVRLRPRIKMLLTGANYRTRRDAGVSNFIAEAAAQGQHATQRLLGVEEALAPVEVAERLAVPVHAPVVVRHLLFVIDLGSQAGGVGSRSEETAAGACTPPGVGRAGRRPRMGYGRCAMAAALHNPGLCRSIHIRPFGTDQREITRCPLCRRKSVL